MRTYKIAVAVIAIIITSNTGDAQERLAYHIRNGKVYYENTELRSSDPYSFTELGYGYAKDAFSAYYFGRKLEGSGINFQVLNNGYAKDNFSVWYRGQLVKE